MKAARREKEQRMVLVVANKPEQFENKFPWILDNTHEQLNETTWNQYIFLILYVGGLIIVFLFINLENLLAWSVKLSK